MSMRPPVAEPRIHPAQLVLPAIVADGLDAPLPISSLPGAVQHLPQYGQAAQFFAVPEFRIGTQHTAGAHDAGRAQQLRLHLLAALLQLCRQLFQLQQFSSTLGSAFGSKTGGVGGFDFVGFVIDDDEFNLFTQCGWVEFVCQFDAFEFVGTARAVGAS